MHPRHTTMPITTRTPFTAAAALASMLATGCDTGAATATEVRMAIDETVATGQAEAIQQDFIEISTSFTLGDAAESALLGIEAFIKSQSACSTVTPTSDHGIVIDFGSLGDACSYNGHTYAGTITIALESRADSAIVHHTLAGLSNGTVTLDGTADVTWTAETRRVETDLSIMRDAGTTELTGDRTMKLLDKSAGLVGGIVVDGTRDWTNQRGAFALEIDHVELRPADPVPQAGAYHLTLPSGNTLDLAFTRLDADTIEIHVTGPRRDRIFHVTRTGAVDEASG